MKLVDSTRMDAGEGICFETVLRKTNDRDVCDIYRHRTRGIIQRWEKIFYPDKDKIIGIILSVMKFNFTDKNRTFFDRLKWKIKLL